MLLANGNPAPPFSMRAAVSERPFSLQDPAVNLMLLFHSYQTAPLAADVVRVVRHDYPQYSYLTIASVADMRIVPRLLRGVANNVISQAYKEAEKEVPKGENPSNHIIILPDWEGRLFQVYQIPDTKKNLGVVLINQLRLIESSYFGTQPAPAALKLLQTMQKNGSHV